MYCSNIQKCTLLPLTHIMTCLQTLFRTRNAKYPSFSIGTWLLSTVPGCGSEQWARAGERALCLCGRAAGGEAVQNPALATTPGLPLPAGTQPSAMTPGSCSDAVLQPETHTKKKYKLTLKQMKHFKCLLLVRQGDWTWCFNEDSKSPVTFLLPSHSTSFSTQYTSFSF